MNIAPRNLLGLMVLLAAASVAAPSALAQSPGPLRGKALLLDNDRVLEGDIEKVESQYRVKRSIGELWLPASRVKRLCKDIDECYEAMKREVNLKDADERVKLARWCQINGLKDQALNEAKIALDMRPDHRETISLVQMLQRFAISSTPVPTSATTKAGPRATHPQPVPQLARGTSVDVSNDAFATFATRVQPILMNTCVSCHSNGRGGAFQLLRVSDGGHRASAQGNLKIVLDFVNVEKPLLSPLLIKSVVAHGGAATPPLKGRQTVPYQMLQLWVDQLLEGNPHLKEMRHAEGVGSSTSAKKDYSIDWSLKDQPSLPPVPSLPPLRTQPPVREPLFDAKKEGEIVSKLSPAVRFDGTPAPIALPKAAAPPAVNAPQSTAAPRDPFDPAEFNSRPK